jgi:hypothetical protein
MTSRRPRTKSSHFVSAVAFADRGLPSNMAISPNKSFIIVCLVALNVNVITSDESLAIPQFGPYPVRPSESPR